MNNAQWKRVRLLRWKGDYVSRFWEKVERTTSCWNWTGAKNVEGYGLAWFNSKLCSAHRISFLLSGNTIPVGMNLDHLCRNRGCVNPEHLEPVTQRVNTLRGESFAAKRAKQTHCVNGHEFTLENTRMKNNGTRQCRACDKVKP